MKFGTLLGLVFIFCISILVVVNQDPEKPVVVAEKQKFDGPGEFELFHRAIRTPDDAAAPQYKSGFIIKEFQQAKTLAQARKSSGARTKANGVLEWTSRGPNNVPGRTRGLIVDPDDPEKNTWFAGSAGGGVWKTVNGGFSWTLITPTLPNLATTVLAMAPSNPNIIYLGTGEGFNNIDRIRGNGMYKSTNRGQTWSYLPNTASFSDINRAIVDPANASIIVVCTSNGIYRSTDGGNNWTQVSNRLSVQDLKATPGNFNIQYATQNGVGVLKSTDGGITWALSNAGMSVSGRIEIDISPVTPDRIFASAQGNLTSSNSDLYVSNDAGSSWSLVNVSFNNTAVNFLGTQGWYDNTVACDPFNADIVYVGGINVFRIRLTSGSTATANYTLQEDGTQNFLLLINFASASNANFQVGSAANNTSVEVRFGPGKSQKAHRFLVPEGATSGVPDANYSYADYVTVPFEVWDITNNRQLMVSFRDQDRNGQFNLKQNNTSGEPLEQSREYVFINNVDYNAQNPSAGIAMNGGHINQQMYFFWPVLVAGKSWPGDVVESQLRFLSNAIPKLNAETVISSDAYNQYDGKNRFINYGSDMHPDQHNLVMIPMSPSTYKILVANDGGVFISNTSATPGINAGDWSMRGITYNTSQFYGADKRPGVNEYIGGMQDNGTWKSPANSTATASTNYTFNLGGDGFEVIWHNLDDKKLIGGSQGNNFSRSINGGLTWSNATSGLSGSHPFISKLANSRDNPDAVFTLSSEGVFRSLNFGQTWSLIPITEKWGTSSSLMDVEVSRANASIIWAGSGMVNFGTLRSLHVSTNGGESFAPTNNYQVVPLGNITKLASHPYEPNTAYALFSFADKPKILRTTNLGQTWEDISGFGAGSSSTNGFPNVAVYCLYVRTDNPDIIWVGTEIGIVESLDNGQTWDLITDFPSVSVWDMKAQDDQVVIATHGRGIWTATIDALQINPVQTRIVDSGTSPAKKLLLKIRNDEPFDKIEIYESGLLVGSISNAAPADRVVQISNLAPGIKNIKLVSYRGNAPYHSKTYQVNHLDLLAVTNSYATYFSSFNDLILSGFALQPLAGGFPGERNVLQSSHPYPVNSESTMIIRHPIKIANIQPLVQYEDIAIVEPGLAGADFGSEDFKDYVVVEATKNGLDWIPLSNGYDARLTQSWFDAFTTGASGTKSMFVAHDIDLTEKFSVSDTVLIRYRMFSNASVTGWGWAVSFIAIQQPPTAVEKYYSNQNSLALYPNPAKEKVTVEFELERASDINLQLIDALGRTSYRHNLGTKEAGKHFFNLSLENQRAGNYYIIIKSSQGDKRGKLIIRN